MHNSSVKWGHLENLDLELNKHNFPLPTLWGHLAHFELGSIFHNYYNLNCKLVP